MTGFADLDEKLAFLGDQAFASAENLGAIRSELHELKTSIIELARLTLDAVRRIGSIVEEVEA